MNNPIVVDFPLEGEWIAPQTPGKRVPSHGTDRFAETYAYDFVKVEANGKTDKFYTTSLPLYLIRGVPLGECYGWGADIRAPFDGVIVRAEDGVPERNNVNLFRDVRYTRELMKKLAAGRAAYRDIAGNHIVMRRAPGVFALFAHLKTGSVVVKAGQNVERGRVIGQVGHSGNSTAPHLHFQLMDDEDAGKAHGLPCAFAEYEELRNGEWTVVRNGIPGRHRIRK